MIVVVAAAVVVVAAGTAYYADHVGIAGADVVVEPPVVAELELAAAEPPVASFASGGTLPPAAEPAAEPVAEPEPEPAVDVGIELVAAPSVVVERRPLLVVVVVEQQ